MGCHRRTILATSVILFCGAQPTHAQVDLVPRTMAPGAWERLALRVINQVAVPTVEVVLTVPEVVGILAVEPQSSDWTFRVETRTDSTPQRIRWHGGSIEPGEFQEFAFLGRLPTDVPRKELVFPVAVVKADGSRLEWSRPPADGEAPVIQIVGSTEVTPWGAVAVSGAALGLSALAIGIAISRRRN